MNINVEFMLAFTSILGTIVGTMFGIAWKYFLSDIKDNTKRVVELEDKHDEDIDELRNTIHDEFERIRNYVGSTASLGQDDHDLLQRIDERVNRLQDNMDDMQKKINYIHDKNGGNK